MADHELFDRTVLEMVAHDEDGELMQTRRLKKLIAELREHCKNGVPYELFGTPTPGMTNEQRAALEVALKHAFELWRDTWVTPWVDRIEATALPPNKVGR